MKRGVTMRMMVSRFRELMPDMWERMIFACYRGDCCVEAYFDDDTMLVYNYLENDIEYFDGDRGFDDYLHDRYFDTMVPLTEANYRKQFAELLQGRMDARLISRREVSRSIGISDSALFRYMSGERTPSAYIVYLLNRNLRNSKSDPWHLL